MVIYSSNDLRPGETAADREQRMQAEAYYCKRATEIYDSYINAPALYKTAADGEKTYLSDEEAADLALGEDERAVRYDVEHPRIALDELRVDSELVLDTGCQTGSPGQVASTDAVADRDPHGSRPPLSIHTSSSLKNPRGDRCVDFARGQGVEPTL